MKTIRGYGPDSERKCTAPEAPRIVGPEPMTPKIPKWIKPPIFYFALLYLGINSCGFFLASGYRSERMSKSVIEEKIDKSCSDKGSLEKFVIDDLWKPGRELAYLIFGDGKQQK